MNVKKIIIILLLTSPIISHGIPNFMIDRIKRDLSYFVNIGITQDALEKTVKKDYFFVRCQIINQKIKPVYATFLNECPDIFIKNAGQHRLNIFLFLIQELLKKLTIPDIDFIISLSDGFIGNSDLYNLEAPVFTFSKWDIDEKLVLIPDIDVLHNCEHYIKATKNANELHAWDKKIERIVWRGLPTGNHSYCCFKDNQRFKAVELSYKYPDLIDAKYTGLLPHLGTEVCEIIEKNGFLGNSLSLAEQIKFKYQLYIDGFTNSYLRSFWQLWSNCVMLKPFSRQIQWYYDGLIANVHYVAIDANLSDLKNKFEFLKINQDFAQNIVKSANLFAENYLNKNNMENYIKYLFEEYAKLQKFKL